MKAIAFLFAFICISYTSKSQIAVDTATIDTDSVRTIVDSPAVAIGGALVWKRFLERNLTPSVGLDNGAPSGTYNVRISFIINKDGSISNITPLTHYGYGIDQECAKVIKMSPNWKPAIKDHKPVRYKFIQPFTFAIHQ